MATNKILQLDNDLKIINTGDGSKTIFSKQFREHYHSTFGAVNESKHIFINAGYNESLANPLAVFEVGFGTGLNAYLTLLNANKQMRHTYYETIERYPIHITTIEQLAGNELFLKIHRAPWEQTVAISPYFTLRKRKEDLCRFTWDKSFDVVYFDAFSPEIQPEMWNKEIFAKIYDTMNPDAVLTTYCAKGIIRRTLQDLSFVVERLPGPEGKREILRARK